MSSNEAEVALDTAAISQAVAVIAANDPVQQATTLAMILTRIAELSQIVHDSTQTIEEVRFVCSRHNERNRVGYLPFLRQPTAIPCVIEHRTCKNIDFFAAHCS
jgi:hypothetical protein